VKCLECQADNPARAKFCGQCGAKLGLTCPGCGAETPPGAKFCGECGTALGAALQAKPPTPASGAAGASEPTEARAVSAPPPADAIPEGEHKQVTVLFCDLSGVPALAEGLGAEGMHTLLQRFFELALAEVHRYEGTISQFLGDGFMALFGAPIAHEDHAHRALLAALGLRKRLAERAAELAAGRELGPRMGLDTGSVVVGNVGNIGTPGGVGRNDYTAVGDARNAAARLQQVAAPGTIVVSAATASQIEGYAQLEEQGPVRVAGRAEPILAWRVVGLRFGQADRPISRRGGPLSPFVGRDRELAVLLGLKEQAAEGHGQVVGLAGEAGSGKSRLLYELRQRLGSRPVAYLAGRCLSYGTGIPYLPLLDLLRGAWGLTESPSPAEAAAKIRASLAEVGDDPGESLPYFLRLLGIKEGADGLAGLEPQAIQTRTFAALRRMLLAASRRSLLILEIEDLHWIDATSEELLASLVEALAAASILLLVTYRAGYPPRWMDKSYATQINMRSLSAEDSRTVVAAILKRSQVSEELASSVLPKAEGNPFYLEELTRSLVEQGADAAVPDTVQGLLAARIDRLPQEHKRVLQTASVLGREIPLDLLAAIWDRPTRLEPLLLDLKRWEFLHESPTVEQNLYVFHHALTQEVAYQTLLTGRRQALHAAAGRALERLHEGQLEEVYDRLIYHYPKTAETAKAVLYLTLFADQAARNYAHAEAAQALRQALEHAERLPAGERDPRLLDLVLRLASSLLPLARFPETLELLKHYRAALEAVADPALSACFFFWLAHTYSYLGNQDEAAENARLSIAAAEFAGDEATQGKASYVLGRDCFWSGRFSEGIEHSLKAIVLLERSGEPWWQGQAYWVAGFHHYALGRLEAALLAMSRAHAIGEALGDHRLDTSWSTGYFHASTGDVERGIADCRGGFERARDPLNTAAALGFLGYAYLEKGDVSAAREALEPSVRMLHQTGFQPLLGWFLAFLAEVDLKDGAAARARELALQALSITREAKFLFGVGLAQRTLGRIERASGDLAGAQTYLRKALDTFTALEVPFEAARTHVDLAELAHAQGVATDATRELALAHRGFAELGSVRYQERVARLSAELALPVPLAAALAPS
jgi:class 3 adenylate cyclase/tetratricopeptide (TPR) repeat protein/ribosomal protein L40E